MYKHIKIGEKGIVKDFIESGEPLEIGFVRFDGEFPVGLDVETHFFDGVELIEISTQSPVS